MNWGMFLSSLIANLAILVAGVTAAWIAIKKNSVSSVTVARNGVIAEWTQLVANLQEQHTACLCHTRELAGQVKDMHANISTLHDQLSALRFNIERMAARTEAETVGPSRMKG